MNEIIGKSKLHSNNSPPYNQWRSILLLTINGEVLSSLQSMENIFKQQGTASNFNDFFVNVSPNLAKSITKSKKSPLRQYKK